MSREWLISKPHGPIVPASACPHSSDQPGSECTVAREGVPRVAGRVPYRVVLDPVYIGPGPCIREASASTMEPESIYLGLETFRQKTLFHGKKD